MHKRCPKSSHIGFYLKYVYQNSSKNYQIFGQLCKKTDHEELSKIGKSGHTQLSNALRTRIKKLF